MAETRRFGLAPQLDIEQILLEAQNRWLRPAEICEILRNYNKFRISPEPAHRPPNGSLFLFDRKVLRYFRKDGHNWRKKRDGKTIKEAHERLKAGSVDVLHCYYAHGENNENFQRRSYWLLEEELSNIVLVHYREVKGNRTHYNRTRGTEGVIPNSLEEEILPDTEVDSSLSSKFQQYGYNVPSQTTDTTSLNSTQTSEYADAESAYSYRSGSGLQSFHKLQQSDAEKMDDALSVPYYSALSNDYQGSIQATSHIQPIHPSRESALNIVTGWGNENSAQDCGDAFGKIEEFGNHLRGQGGWQSFEGESLHLPKWSMEQNLQQYPNYNQNAMLYEGNIDSFDLFNYTESQHGEQNGQFAAAEVGSFMKTEVENSATVDAKANHLALKQPLDGLKNLDSFGRWMSKELGDVNEAQIQSSSGAYWEAVGSEVAVVDSNISSQLEFETYTMSPSLSQDQLFSIIDFSPNCAYSGTEVKVVITGRFLKSHQDVVNCKWACMFGEAEVPAEVVADGVLHCHTPHHDSGRVPFYVTCANRLACSEIREFEFKVYNLRDVDAADLSSDSSSEALLHMRFTNLLSIRCAYHNSVPGIMDDNLNFSSNLNSLIKDENEWQQIFMLTSTDEFSSETLANQFPEKLLKEKLHAWLREKVAEGGKGPSVVDEGGQGVLHFAAALGYDWAITPTVAAGVNINFRDVNGWTALHWAAYFGREHTVPFLISQGAAPGALTDPSPKYPRGRDPAELASANGHKGIAGYIAECALSSHLSSLNLKDANNCDAGGVPSLNDVQAVAERTPTPISDGDFQQGLSLKDSLAAVCHATQAAARIHQVYRIQSFQKKQLKEYDDSQFGMSDEHALSLLAVKSSRAGQHDEPVHAAATRIQNKFRSYKGRKDFLIFRQRVVKIQAHVRGHQVRKNYKKIIWSVGILDKVILRWKRKGRGLSSFKTETRLEGPSTQGTSSKEDDYDFLKEGRKQTEERLQKALARVKSMVQYPEARDQYRRLLNVVSEMKETKATDDMAMNNSDEAAVTADYFDDDLLDLEALLGDDTFMFAEA
ncbi:calmodulin-binding transcription activator 3 isoform X1 [Daucus carota subsp. sativus]|uniref:calmodulin-binding transcription activator 3 isoform X1 n=1 Tax=Daucus carota subsp. sativus TaxID=79200 RepID=UPI0007EF0094|nr:PREDICTED: calmodulin-binding transcription activator 3-like [Daucus carota subsp. sativus]